MHSRSPPFPYPPPSSLGIIIILAFDVAPLSRKRWYPGDQVLAPFSKDGKLYEATVKTISTDEHGKTVAIVKFSSFNDETVLINTLRRRKKKEPFQGSIFDDEDLEKPFFHDKKPPGPAVSLKLSEDGVCVPYTINRYLRDYQRNGIKFLYKHYISGKGCILGDDMGLGKTIQVISFLAAVLHKRGTREDIENNMPEFVLKSMKKESRAIHDKIFLIVAPLSVLYNWKEELETWGYFRVYILHGNKKDHAFRGIRRKKCEIALTTYETLRLCLNDINSIEWSAVFVDEAHKIKNPKAQITQAMKALKCRVRIGLTGTILQNNVEELWCVMDWAVTGCLGNRSRFKEDFGNPIEFGQRHTATKRELAMGRKAMRKLAKQMSYWFLRRTKAIISDQLPKKDDRVVYCSLTEFQKMVYQAVLQTEDIMLVLRGWDPCDCNSGRKRKSCCYKQNQYGNTVRQIYFSYLALLRKVSNHVALLQPDDSTSKMQASTVKRVCEQVFHKFPEFVQQSKQAAFETISDPKYSGKMKVLQLLLEHFRRNHDKVLLFSLSTKLLDVLEKYCMAAGLDYRRLDGGTKSEERVRIVKEFNSTQDINICLVSTMAGGLGLNFVGANIVVMFDATWNPANDLQAIDRVYRIGQCRDVKVFRLISLGTVEEIMYLRQVYKQQLHCAVVGSENAKRYFSAVQGSKEHPGELFGIHNLFRFRTGGACLTRDIMKREGQVEAGMMTAATQLREEPPAPKLETVSLPSSQALFDFSSDSETEPSLVTKSKNDKGRTKETSNSADMRGQLTLLQCGFSKLLEGKIDTREECSENDSSSDNESSDSQCEEETSSNVIGAPLAKADLRLNYTTTSEPQSAAHGHTLCAKEKVCQNWSDSSDSEADLRSEHEHPGTSGNAAVALGTDSNTEESDDVILPSQAAEQKKKTLAKKKTGRDFLSEDLESSDDTIQYNTKLHLYSAFQVGRTSQGAGQSGISDNEKFTSISSDVQEVAFVHSNQRVIGSSKAENRMSRTALRDVFELNRYSQIPANLNTSEVKPRLEKDHALHLFYAIRDKIKNCNLVICNRTWKFPAGSPEGKKVLVKLPKHILSSASTQRLTMLSNFHTTRHPELKDVLPDRLPESELEGDFTVPRSRFSTTTGCSTSEDANSSLIQELSGEETNHFRKQHLQERAVCFEMQNEINSENEKSSRDSVNLQHSYKETGLSEKGSTCKSDNKQGIITQCKADSVTELLGDTSILDELFERRKPTALQPKKVSGHAPKGKTKSKDFWDFLNEASDGYVSALTDLSVTERLCESAPLNSKEREKGSLWKKNEKFLWKKDDPENDPGATTSGTSQLWKQNS
uniref:DNA excision repair protein ERCC-6-like 2 n=1 Tax=Callorhinchus milii TaxID=7868 RepID=A0A4W3IC95_CALMI